MTFLALGASALLISVVKLPDEAKAIDLKVEQAIVYQSGLVMLTRSAPVEKGAGRYKITVVPEAAEGSLWYGVSGGATVGDVVTRLRFEPRVERFTLNTPAQLVAANVGKRVRFAVLTNSGAKEWLQGVIEYVRPPQEMQAGLRLEDGTLRGFSPAAVTDIETKGLATSVEVKTRVPQRTMEIEVQASQPARLWVLSMERGAAWAGSYAVETMDGNEATFLFKLQLALGALKLESSDVKLLAGSPRLPGSIRTDLSSGSASFAAMFGERSSQRQIPDIFSVLFDPYDEIGKVLRERQMLIAEATYAGFAQPFYGGGPYRGGFGGGGMGGAGIDFLSYDPADNSIVNRPDFSSSSYKGPEGTPEELLDLISYPIGKLSLEPGDRMSRVQFKSKLKCEPVVRWNLAFRPEADYKGSIGRFLRLPNESSLYWTPGPCLISHLGTPVALSNMPLTPPKENGYVRVDDAEAVLHTRQVREISRTPLNFASGRFEIIAEFTFTLGNTTAQPIEFEIAQEIDGKVIEAADAKTRTINPFSVPNPKNVVEWKIRLAPGETKEFRMTYSHRQF